MQESDSMDKTDTSKTGQAKNVSPFNLNLAELALLGCDAQCANGLGQNNSTYNICNDMNEDGYINVLDIIIIANIILNAD